MTQNFIRFDKTDGRDMLDVTIADDLKVVVPNDLGQITPFVLLEQEDWFEDEIHFIRKLARPDTAMVDIGANFGIYTLAMAKAVQGHNKSGDKSRFWAIEPASNTANHLRHSVKANGFEHIEVLQLALSDNDGDGFLTIAGSSELNALADGPGANTEQVKLTTLDTLAADKFDGTTIDFIKIDAEGAEADILRGGATFFAEQSPLAMFELKHGDEVNTALIKQFSDMGYNSYRLIPGLNVLVPFSLAEPVPGYMLNLFACKEDCAQALMERGLLLHPIDDKAPLAPASWDEFLALQPWIEASNTGWADWGRGELRAADQILKDALCHWAAAHKPHSAEDDQDKHAAAMLRYKQLLAASQRIQSHPSLHNSTAQGRPPLLLTAARIMGDMGQRGIRLNYLRDVLKDLTSGKVQLPAPFLAPAVRFDNLTEDFNMVGWLGTGIAETINDLQAFSNCFVDPNAGIELMKPLITSSYPRAETARRYILMVLKTGAKFDGPLPAPFALLGQEAPDHRNAAKWQPYLA